MKTFAQLQKEQSEKIRSEHIRKNNMVINNAHIFRKLYPHILDLALTSNIRLDADVDLENIL
jgi:hypothetical protein